MPPKTGRYKGTLSRSVAASLDAPDELAPHLNTLFADLTALGSSPRRVANLLARHGADKRWRIADVGSGKGAVGIEVARRIGCRVIGFDGYLPFVEFAAKRALELGIDQRCTFMVADIRRTGALVVGGRYDAAVMLGVRPLPEALPMLIPLVRRRGLIIIDDAVRLRGEPRIWRGLRINIGTRNEARDAIGRAGGTILEEAYQSRGEAIRQNRVIYRRLLRRARELERREPTLRSAIREFLARQREGNAMLSGPIRSAAWAIRRD